MIDPQFILINEGDEFVRDWCKFHCNLTKDAHFKYGDPLDIDLIESLCHIIEYTSTREDYEEWINNNDVQR